MHKCLNLTKHQQSTPKLNLIIFVLKPYVTNALYLDVTKVRFCASGQGADMLKGRLSAATNGIWQGGINRINKAVCSKGAECHYRQFRGLARFTVNPSFALFGLAAMFSIPLPL